MAAAGVVWHSGDRAEDSVRMDCGGVEPFHEVVSRRKARRT